MQYDDPKFWRAGAISTTAVMAVVLGMLTIDSLAAITPGGSHVLALWARRTDAAPWQSTTSIVTGSLLILLITAHQFLWISATLLFWCILWAGLVPAIVSLWSALYRPATAG